MTKDEMKELDKKYSLEEDPDDLGVVPYEDWPEEAKLCDADLE